MGPILVYWIPCRADGPGPYARFFVEQTGPAHLVDRPSSKWFGTFIQSVQCICLLRVYVPSCAFPSVCMFIHVYVPPCVCPFMCTSPPYACPLHVCPLRMYVPSVCISPPCVCPLRVYIPSAYMSPLCVCPLRVYVPSVCMFLCLVVPSCVCCLHVYVPPCTCSFRVYFPFVCLSFRVYVSSYDCCWNSNSLNNRLVRQVSGVHKLTSVPRQFGRWGRVQRLKSVLTSVGSLGCGRWGTQAHVFAQASWVVGVHLFFCQLPVCQSSLRVRFLPCGQLRVRLSSVRVH